ncbi:hypothetical protein ES705_30992 [subsurface metagenome]
MIIETSDFDNDGEVDFTANYREGMNRGRAALRRHDGIYEVYVKWFFPEKKEALLHKGSLQECLDFSNARFGFNDTVK